MQPKLFNLQQGEKILKEIKPLPQLKNYLFALYFGIITFVWLFMGGGLFLMGIEEGILLQMFFLWLIILIIFLAIAFLACSKIYSQTHYWVSSKRIIVKRGFLGYTITSIPFERVSDIIISRSFLETLFGFGSLQIQSLAGQFTYSTGGRWGAEGLLLAVPEPEKLQEFLFELIKKKRKAEKLTF